MPPVDWDERLIALPLRWKGHLALLDLFSDAAPPSELGPDEAKSEIALRLRSQPELIERWQTYSYDKRATPEPYLDGLEVGMFDAGRHDVATYTDPVDACADFIYREVLWRLRGRPPAR